MQFVKRTFANASVRQPELRAKILMSKLAPAESEIFDMPIEKWGQVDHATLPGFHQCDAAPVDPLTCRPVDSTHPLLKKVTLFPGPVTKLAADAIVNAANEVALGGGGVDGAIHTGAGRLLRRECATFPCCPTGQCFITKGYNLPARYVLHTVGPMGEYPDYLRSSYRSLLSLVKANGLRTVGICWISVGIYGYPLEAGVEVAVNEVMSFLKDNSDSVDRICFACFKDEEMAAAKRAIALWESKSTCVL